jgi:hypothetical protein
MDRGIGQANFAQQAKIADRKISHAQAIEKAEKEFEIYRAREMRLLESDFDKAVKQLNKK